MSDTCFTRPESTSTEIVGKGRNRHVGILCLFSLGLFALSGTNEGLEGVRLIDSRYTSPHQNRGIAFCPESKSDWRDSGEPCGTKLA